MPAPSAPMMSIARCSWPDRPSSSANRSVNMLIVCIRTSVGVPGTIWPFCRTMCSPYSAVLA